MKRLAWIAVMLVVALSFMVPTVYAAGTVYPVVNGTVVAATTIGEAHFKDMGTKLRFIEFEATGDAADGSLPDITLPVGSMANGYKLSLIRTVPVTGSEPTSTFTIAWKDNDAATYFTSKAFSNSAADLYRVAQVVGYYDPIFDDMVVDIADIGLEKKARITLVFERE